MTDDEINEVGPAFARSLRRSRDCVHQKRMATHFDNSTRGLLSDLPRKTVEPIALACRTSARTLSEVLITADAVGRQRGSGTGQCSVSGRG